MKQLINNLKYRYRKVSDYYTYLPIIMSYHDGWALYWFNWFYVFVLPRSEKLIPTIRMNVNMKQIRGMWYCFQTIRGYDYSFNSKTEAGARRQMTELIRRLYSVTGRLEVNLNVTYKD